MELGHGSLDTQLKGQEAPGGLDLPCGLPLCCSLGSVRFSLLLCRQNPPL